VSGTAFSETLIRLSFRSHGYRTFTVHGRSAHCDVTSVRDQLGACAKTPIFMSTFLFHWGRSRSCQQA